MKIKLLLIIFSLVIVLSFAGYASATTVNGPCSDNNSYSNQEVSTVAQIAEVARQLPVGQFSQHQHLVCGYVVDVPTAKNSAGNLSFTIVDDLANPQQKITVFAANSALPLNQFDKVIVKAYVRNYSSNNVVLSAKNLYQQAAEDCQITAVVPSLAKDTAKLTRAAASDETVTMLQIANFLQGKQEHYPLSDEFIEKYQQKDGGYIELAESLGLLVDRQQHSPNQKWHFFDSWFYPGIDAGTITWEADARSRVYSGLKCPELLLWIFEACGVSPTKVRVAMDVAMQAKSAGTNVTTMAANMRKCVPWEDIYANFTEKIAATNVTLSTNALQLEVGGASQKLTASVLPVEATEVATWSIVSGDDCITLATSGNSATVTAVKQGSATIKVLFNDNVFATCSVTVVDNTPATIQGLPTAIDLDINQTIGLVPVLSKGTGTFTYQVANESVATVTSDGVVTGVANGGTTILVTCVEQPALTCTVVVEVCNHGVENNPISVSAALALAQKICTTEGSRTTQAVCVTGVVSTAPSALGSFLLRDLDTDVTIEVSNCVVAQGVDNVAQNDIIVLSGHIFSSQSQLQFAISGDVHPQVVSNQRGQSVVSVANLQNVTILVDGASFGATQTATNGQTFAFTVVPADGFTLQSVTVNGLIITATGEEYSFLVAGDSVISATAFDLSSSTMYTYSIIDGLSASTRETTDTSLVFDWFVFGGSGNGIITSVSAVTKIYSGASGGSGETRWTANNVFKIGTGSANGSITLQLAEPVNYVKITGYVYNNSAKIRVGDSASTDWTDQEADNRTTLFACADMNVASKAVVDANQTSTVTIKFAPTSSLTIATVNKNPLCIAAIELGIDNAAQ